MQKYVFFFFKEDKNTEWNMATSFIETVFHIFILFYLFRIGDAVLWIYFTELKKLKAEPLFGSSVISKLTKPPSWCYQWSKRSAAAQKFTSTKKALKCTDRVSHQNKKTILALADHHEENPPRSPNQNTYRIVAKGHVSVPHCYGDTGRACSVRGKPPAGSPPFRSPLARFRAQRTHPAVAVAVFAWRGRRGLTPWLPSR